MRADRLAEKFEAVYAGDPEDLRQRYNIAPTQPVPVIRTTASGRVISSMRWGLIPSWAKDGSMGKINAPERDSPRKASIQRELRAAPLFDSSRRVLRMEEEWQDEAAFPLRNEGRLASCKVTYQSIQSFL